MRIVIEKKLPVVVRLGGFHFLKSYLRSIGMIMSVSGLLDVSVIVYQGSSIVEHRLSGSVYAKAIRTHLLVDVALCVIGLRNVFTKDDLQNIKTFIYEWKIRKLGANDKNSLLDTLDNRINENLSKIQKS